MQTIVELINMYLVLVADAYTAVLTASKIDSGTTLHVIGDTDADDLPSFPSNVL